MGASGTPPVSVDRSTPGPVPGGRPVVGDRVETRGDAWMDPEIAGSARRMDEVAGFPADGRGILPGSLEEAEIEVMTPEARAAMRAVIRTALGTSDLPDSAAAHPGQFDPGEIWPMAELEQRFSAELTALGGVVHQAADVPAVVAIIASLLERESSNEVLAWHDEWLPLAGIAEGLASAGIRVRRQTPGDAQDADARAAWAAAGVGLTGAAACLAETGSVVVVSGPGRGRLASLLPPIHVALVERGSLTRSLPTLLASRPDLATSGANMVCITGPSRTADIEHHLIRGVHGPREIHVIFI